MSKPRASILVVGDCHEATLARRILGGLGATLISDREFSSQPSFAFGLFFIEGSFLRPSIFGPRPTKGILRIRSTPVELLEVGVTTVPQCLQGARALIACRLLTDAETFNVEGNERFRNALREAERVCTRKLRSLMQHHQEQPVSIAA